MHCSPAPLPFLHERRTKPKQRTGVPVKKREPEIYSVSQYAPQNTSLKQTQHFRYRVSSLASERNCRAEAGTLPGFPADHGD